MGEWGNGEMGQWRNRVTAGPIPPFLHHPIPPFGRVIDGSLYRTGLPFVPPRRHEAVSEGRTLLHGEVRNREAQFSAGTAQFRRYFETAERTRGITGEMLLQLLERRLDNVVYRLGLSTSRPQARQLVRHGHFLVNGKKVDIPSYSVRQGDVISVLGRSQKGPTIEHAMEEVKGRGIPEWLSFDANTITGRIVAMPTREQINLPAQEQLIVELYSK